MGIDEKNHPKDSLNHYAMGACLSWLFSHCAGIRPLKPGFEEILIKPLPGGSLTEAEARYKSPVGDIYVKWQIAGESLLLHIETPPGRRTRVELPDGHVYETDGGKMELCCPWESIYRKEKKVKRR